jgi:hypothetical protein
MAPTGTSNRKGKKIPLDCSYSFRHNNSMKIEIPDTTIEALKNALFEDHNKEVNLADLEYKINDLINEWVSELAWQD